MTWSRDLPAISRSNLGIFHGDRRTLPGASSALAIPGARELILHCDQTTEGFGPFDDEDEIAIEVFVDGVPYGSYDLGNFENDDNGSGHDDRLRMHSLLAYVTCEPTKTGVSFTWEGAWEYDQMSGTAA